MASAPLAQLREAVSHATAAVRGDGSESSRSLRLERPKHAGQGDYATNAAMLLAPALRTGPPKIAELLARELHQELGELLERTEVAGPGFLNLFLSDAWYRRALRDLVAAGERFGAGQTTAPERILIEFVSANPTGPLVAHSGRHAAYGDSLVRILERYGHAVSSEYYFNDAGSQVELLGASVKARARGEEVPPGGYAGEYVAELAAVIPDAADGDVGELAQTAVELLLARIKQTLDRYGVHFDTFFLERTLHEGSPSPLEVVLARLEEAGALYRSEGALWMRTTAYGDDKDRVVVRTGGEPTYLASDLAYMVNKRDRGFERQLNPLGADHHAYVGELKAAAAALLGDPDAIEVPMIQFVHLVEGSQRAAMSKRKGAFVTLDELLDEIGVDATRFFMLRSSHDRTLDLDVELARRQSAENPVYYVQYAHARISSMLRRVSAGRLEEASAVRSDWGEGQLDPAERNLIKKLASFPDELAEAATRRAPHRIAAYALELAQEFTAFYRDCRVVGATPEPVESFRIALSAVSGRMIGTSLELLGVSAPESM
ncbi:MAG: arginine--tRNA ligase [Solirubrobacterales bacterium]|nr:arginine--tRNA ligase [Solirubrobacterales bacterium]